MLHWPSVSGWGRERVAIVFASKSSQYLTYGWLKPIASEITHDAKPKIVDIPLTLIFRIGQGACCYSFCIWRQPEPHWWVIATNHDLRYPRCKAKIHWGSIDAHFQNGAVTVTLCLSPIEAANMMVMHNSDQITFQLPFKHDYKMLTLRWGSF